MIIQKGVSLKDYSSYKIGGTAEYFLNAKSKDELINGLKEWKGLGLNTKPVFVLGGGTNILFSDEGFSGLVIHCEMKGVKVEGKKVKVGAGVLTSELLDFCIENSLSGLEWAGGLPGTIGGAVRGNAGAFCGETKDSVTEVKSINIDTLIETTRTNKECFFGYRDSFFKTEKGVKEIILEVTFNFINKSKEEMVNEVQEKINFRKEKHPLEYPSIGSVFKNVQYAKILDPYKEEVCQNIKRDSVSVVSAARIINLCDLKGIKIGDAQFSEKHPNFIINLGNAKANDVKSLIEMAKIKAMDKFKIKLEEEVMYLGYFNS